MIAFFEGSAVLTHWKTDTAYWSIRLFPYQVITWFYERFWVDGEFISAGIPFLFDVNYYSG